MLTSDAARLFANATPATVSTPLCTVLIDAEEDFDWLRPVRGVPYDIGCMRQLADLHTIMAAYGAVPTYMLTYPVLQDAATVASLRRHVAGGRCRVGLQLHPWVNPPYEEAALRANSFGSNLPADLEERKLIELVRLFRAAFGHAPTIFRAGRYGLGPNTPRLLEKHGFEIDTSIAPRTSFKAEAGPDFSSFDHGPFWFGTTRPLLEVPLCRDIVGWGGEAAARLYRSLDRLPSDAQPGPDGSHRRSVKGRLGQDAKRLLSKLMAASRCAERVTLSPEGNDAPAAGRLVAGLLRGRPTILALSLHSSSLVVGTNPYVRDRATLHWFYDRLSAMMDLMATRHAVRFVAGPDLPALLDRPPPVWQPPAVRAGDAPHPHAA